MFNLHFVSHKWYKSYFKSSYCNIFESGISVNSIWNHSYTIRFAATINRHICLYFKTIFQQKRYLIQTYRQTISFIDLINLATMHLFINIKKILSQLNNICFSLSFWRRMSAQLFLLNCQTFSFSFFSSVLPVDEKSFKICIWVVKRCFLFNLEFLSTKKIVVFYYLFVYIFVVK